MPLLITVELIPHGNYKKRVKIGELYIRNEGTGNTNFGNYEFELKCQEYEANLELGTWYKGKIKNYARIKGYWELIKSILNKLKFDEITNKVNY